MPTQQVSLDINIDHDGSAVKSADNVSASIKGIGRSATTTHTALDQMKRGFYAIGGIYLFQKLVKGAHQFDTSIREINTLIKAGSHDINSLRKGIEDFSVAFGQKPQDTAKATYQIISAGASTTIQALERLRVAGKLAVGGVSSYAQSADLLTTVINAYSKSTLTAIQMSDILFTTVRLGKTTMGELASSMGTAAGMAASAGISFGDLNAMIATMTLSNPRTPRVMTQVRSMINNILNPREKALTISRRIKFDFSLEGIEDAGGFTKWMDDFIKKTGGNTKIASEFFTIRGLAGFIGLKNNWEKFNEIQQETTKNFEGATTAAFDKVNRKTQILAQANSLLSREMNRAGDILISIMAPALEEVVAHYDKFKNVALGVAVLFKTMSIINIVIFWIIKWLGSTLALILLWKLWIRQIVFAKIALIKASRAGRIFAASVALIHATLKLMGGLAVWWVLIKLTAVVMALALAWMYYQDKVSPLADHAATLGDIAGVVFNLGGIRGYVTELEKLNIAAAESTVSEKAIASHKAFIANLPTMQNIFGIASPKDIEASYKKLHNNRLTLDKVSNASFFKGFTFNIKNILSNSVSFFSKVGENVKNSVSSGISSITGFNNKIKEGNKKLQEELKKVEPTSVSNVTPASFSERIMAESDKSEDISSKLGAAVVVGLIGYFDKKQAAYQHFMKTDRLGYSPQIKEAIKREEENSRSKNTALYQIRSLFSSIGNIFSDVNKSLASILSGENVKNSVSSGISSITGFNNKIKEGNKKLQEELKKVEPTSVSNVTPASFSERIMAESDKSEDISSKLGAAVVVGLIGYFAKKQAAYQHFMKTDRLGYSPQIKEAIKREEENSRSKNTALYQIRSLFSSIGNIFSDVNKSLASILSSENIEKLASNTLSFVISDAHGANMINSSAQGSVAKIDKNLTAELLEDEDGFFLKRFKNLSNLQYFYRDASLLIKHYYYKNSHASEFVQAEDGFFLKRFKSLKNLQYFYSDLSKIIGDRINYNSHAAEFVQAEDGFFLKRLKSLKNLQYFYSDLSKIIYDRIDFNSILSYFISDAHGPDMINSSAQGSVAKIDKNLTAELLEDEDGFFLKRFKNLSNLQYFYRDASLLIKHYYYKNSHASEFVQAEDGFFLKRFKSLKNLQYFYSDLSKIIGDRINYNSHAAEFVQAEDGFFLKRLKSLKNLQYFYSDLSKIIYDRIDFNSILSYFISDAHGPDMINSSAQGSVAKIDKNLTAELLEDEDGFFLKRFKNLSNLQYFYRDASLLIKHYYYKNSHASEFVQAEDGFFLKRFKSLKNLQYFYSDLSKIIGDRINYNSHAAEFVQAEDGFFLKRLKSLKNLQYFYSDLSKIIYDRIDFNSILSYFISDAHGPDMINSSAQGSVAKIDKNLTAELLEDEDGFFLKRFKNLSNLQYFYRDASLLIKHYYYKNSHASEFVQAEDGFFLKRFKSLKNLQYFYSDLSKIIGDRINYNSHAAEFVQAEDGFFLKRLKSLKNLQYFYSDLSKIIYDRIDFNSILSYFISDAHGPDMINSSAQGSVAKIDKNLTAELLEDEDGFFLKRFKNLSNLQYFYRDASLLIKHYYYKNSHASEFVQAEDGFFLKRFKSLKNLQYFYSDLSKIIGDRINYNSHAAEFVQAEDGFFLKRLKSLKNLQYFYSDLSKIIYDRIDFNSILSYFISDAHGPDMINSSAQGSVAKIDKNLTAELLEDEDGFFLKRFKNLSNLQYFYRDASLLIKHYYYKNSHASEFVQAEDGFFLKRFKSLKNLQYFYSDLSKIIGDRINYNSHAAEFVQAEDGFFLKRLKSLKNLQYFYSDLSKIIYDRIDFNSILSYFISDAHGPDMINSSAQGSVAKIDKNLTAELLEDEDGFFLKRFKNLSNLQYFYRDASLLIKHYYYKNSHASEFVQAEDGFFLKRFKSLKNLQYFYSDLSKIIGDRINYNSHAAEFVQAEDGFFLKRLKSLKNLQYFYSDLSKIIYDRIDFNSILSYFISDAHGPDMINSSAQGSVAKIDKNLTAELLEDEDGFFLKRFKNLSNLQYFYRDASLLIKHYYYKNSHASEFVQAEDGFFLKRFKSLKNLQYFYSDLSKIIGDRINYNSHAAEFVQAEDGFFLKRLKSLKNLQYFYSDLSKIIYDRIDFNSILSYFISDAHGPDMINSSAQGSVAKIDKNLTAELLEDEDGFFLKRFKNLSNLQYFYRDASLLIKHYYYKNSHASEFVQAEDGFFLKRFKSLKNLQYFYSDLSKIIGDRINYNSHAAEFVQAEDGFFLKRLKSLKNLQYFYSDLSKIIYDRIDFNSILSYFISDAHGPDMINSSAQGSVAKIDKNLTAELLEDEDGFFLKRFKNLSNLQYFYRDASLLIKHYYYKNSHASEFVQAEDGFFLKRFKSLKNLQYFYSDLSKIIGDRINYNSHAAEFVQAEDGFFLKRLKSLKNLQYFYSDLSKIIYDRIDFNSILSYFISDAHGPDMINSSAQGSVAKIDKNLTAELLEDEDGFFLKRFKNLSNLQYFYRDASLLIKHYYYKNSHASEFVQAEDGFFLKRFKSLKNLQYFYSDLSKIIGDRINYNSHAAEFVQAEDGFFLKRLKSLKNLQYFYSDLSKIIYDRIDFNSILSYFISDAHGADMRRIDGSMYQEDAFRKNMAKSALSNKDSFFPGHGFGISNPLDGLDKSIQKSALDGSKAFNELGKDITKVALDKSDYFQRLGTSIHEFLANNGLMSEIKRDGQFGLQDMLNMGRSLSDKELEMVGRDLTMRERFLQGRYKGEEAQREFDDLITKHGGRRFPAYLEQIIGWFASDDDIKIADQYRKQKDLERADAIKNYDPKNYAYQPEWVKKMVGREMAQDTQAEVSYGQFMQNKQTELAVLAMDPIRAKLEIAAFETLNEALEGDKFMLDGISANKREVKIRNLALTKVWQEMGNELNQRWITAEKAQFDALRISWETFKRGMIDQRTHTAEFQQANLAYQKASFPGNQRRLQRERDLIKGPGYLQARAQQKRQFDEDAIGKGFSGKERGTHVTDSLYNFDLTKARELRKTVQTQAEKFKEAADQYKLYFKQGLFDDDARTNLDIYTKLLKKLGMSYNELTDAQKKNFQASIESASQHGFEGSEGTLALPEIENNALKRLENLREEEKLLSSLNKHEKAIKKQQDDYIGKSIEKGRTFNAGDIDDINKGIDSDYYRREGDKAAEALSNTLEQKVGHLRRMAEESAKYTDDMRDNAIKKLNEEIDTFDKYLERLEKANKLIGETDLQKKRREAFKEAVKLNEGPLASPEATALDNLVDSAHYDPLGLAAAEKQKSLSQQLSDQIDEVTKLAKKSKYFTDDMRDNAIKKLNEEIDTFDKYLERLEKANKLIGETDLQKKRREAFKEAVKLNEGPLASPEATALDNLVDSAHYDPLGLAAAEKQKSLSQQLSDQIDEVTKLAKKSKYFTDDMRDNAIKKLNEEIDTFDKYLERLEKANKLIGETDLQKKRREAFKEAVKLNEGPLASPEATALDNLVDSAHYDPLGLAAAEKQKSLSQQLSDQIDEVTKLAKKSKYFTDDMRDNAIKKLNEEIDTFDKYLERLEKANKLIGETDLQKKRREAFKEAVKLNEGPLASPEATALDNLVDSAHYDPLGLAAAEKQKSLSQQLSDQIDEVTKLARKSEDFTDAMRDRSIKKLEKETVLYDEYLNQLDRAHKLIGETDLQRTIREGMAAAVVSNDGAPLPPIEQNRVERRLRRNYFAEKEPQQSISDYISDLEKVNDAIGKNTLVHKVRRAELEASNKAKQTYKDLSQTDSDTIKGLARDEVYKTEGQAVTSQYLSDAQKINAELERLNLLRNRNAISEETFRQAAMRTYDQYGLILDNIDSARAKIYGAIERSSTQLTEALVEGALTGELSFQKFADSIVREMLRIAIQAQIVKPLMDAVFGFFGGFGFSQSTASSGAGQSIRGAKDGGFINAQRFMEGGHVRGAGGSREDKVLARLSNGEFVINAESTRRYRGLLEEINDNSYASGGYVGGSTSGSASGTRGGNKVNINVYNNASGVEAEATTEENSEGGLDVSIMINQITSKIASDTARGKGLAPVLQKRYSLNPAAGMR